MLSKQSYLKTCSLSAKGLLFGKHLDKLEENKICVLLERIYHSARRQKAFSSSLGYPSTEKNPHLWKLLLFPFHAKGLHIILKAFFFQLYQLFWSRYYLCLVLPTFLTDRSTVSQHQEHKSKQQLLQFPLNKTTTSQPQIWT